MKNSIVGFLGILGCLLAGQAVAVVQKGEIVPNKCWQTVDEKQFCLDDAKDTVRVLIHSAGWCGPCNAEMAELAPKVGQFNGKPVTFISISGNGWEHGSLPTTDFLKAWQSKYAIPFPVVASPKDAGKAYFEPPLYIPNVVIIDKAGRLIYKDFAPGVETIFAEVNAALLP